MDGGLEVEGGMGVVELGGRDVPGGWEVAVGVVVDDIGGGVDDGGVEEGAGAEDDGIKFGEEVTDGNPEDDDINDNDGDDCGVGDTLVGVGGVLQGKKKTKNLCEKMIKGVGKHTARIRMAAVMMTPVRERSNWRASSATITAASSWTFGERKKERVNHSLLPLPHAISKELIHLMVSRA